MLFHVRLPSPKGASPTTGEPAPPRYVFSIVRGVVGLAFFLALLVGAFAAKSQSWDDGATALLHMSEVVFGGLAGLIFGEKLAISNVTKP